MGELSPELRAALEACSDTFKPNEIGDMVLQDALYDAGLITYAPWPYFGSKVRRTEAGRTALKATDGE
jgi:hypothetical protein